MLFNKVSGGGQKVTINGKPSTEKINLTQSDIFSTKVTDIKKYNILEDLITTDPLCAIDLENEINYIATYEHYYNEGKYWRHIYKGNLEIGWTEIGKCDTNAIDFMGLYGSKVVIVNNRSSFTDIVFLENGELTAINDCPTGANNSFVAKEKLYISGSNYFLYNEKENIWTDTGINIPGNVVTKRFGITIGSKSLLIGSNACYIIEDINNIVTVNLPIKNWDSKTSFSIIKFNNKYLLMRPQTDTKSVVANNIILEIDLEKNNIKYAGMFEMDITSLDFNKLVSADCSRAFKKGEQIIMLVRNLGFKSFELTPLLEKEVL